MRANDIWPIRLQVVQQPGQLLVVPPCALCFRRAGASGGVILQWLRAGVGCVLSALDFRKVPVFPREAEVAPWRQRQLRPPVQLAAYLMLAEWVQTCSSKRGKASPLVDTSVRSEASSLLEICRRLLSTERLPSHWPVTVIGDNALRACDHCACEIFNRCVRIERPLMRTADQDEHAPWRRQWMPNPSRIEERAAGESGDFCFACVTERRVSCESGGGAALLQHAPHDELEQLLSMAESMFADRDGQPPPERKAGSGQPCSLAERAGKLLQDVGALDLTDAVTPEASHASARGEGQGGRRAGKAKRKGADNPIRLRGGAAEDDEAAVKEEGTLEADEGGGGGGRGGGERGAGRVEEAPRIKDELRVKEAAGQQKRSSGAVSGVEAKRQRAAACDDPNGDSRPSHPEEGGRMGMAAADDRGAGGPYHMNAGPPTDDGFFDGRCQSSGGGGESQMDCGSRCGSFGPSDFNSGDPLRDEAMRELSQVIDSEEFNQFCKFCQSQGIFHMPQDVPRMAFKYIDDQTASRLDEVEGARHKCMEEQKGRVSEIMSSIRDDKERHQQVNRVLAQTQSKVRIVTAEIDRIRNKLSIQKHDLETMHKQNQEQMQQQQRQQVMMRQQQAYMQQVQQSVGGGPMFGGGGGCGRGGNGDWGGGDWGGGPGWEDDMRMSRDSTQIT